MQNTKPIQKGRFPEVNIMLKFRWETEFKETEIGEIPKDWDVRQVKELVDKRKKFPIVDGPFGTQLHMNEYVSKGIPVIRVINLTYEGKFLKENLVFITEEKFEQLKRSEVNPYDLIIAKTGATIGKLALLPPEIPKGLISSSCLKVSFDKKLANPKYYLKFFMHSIGQENIKIRAEGGSTRDTINLTPFSEIPVPYPSPEEQSRIAAVLSWFDDLIENKKRQNEILEKVAMAIFKSWFVDFEPFKDEEFVYNEELGKEIPKKWEVKKLGRFAEIIMGQSPSSKYYNKKGKGLPFIQGKGQYGRYIPETTVYCSKLLKVAKLNDVLVTVRAPVGELNLADREYVIGRGVASLRSKYWTFLFLYLLTYNERLKSYERGTTYDAITREELDTFPLLLPPQPILQRFHSLVEPLFQKIILNQKQIMVLRKIRDTLLPKLVFGKLRVVKI